MAVGESVSNGTLWDTRRPRRGNIALPSMGFYLVDLIVPPYLWDLNGDHGFNFRARGELSSLGLRDGFLLRGSVRGSWTEPSWAKSRWDSSDWGRTLFL